MKKKYYCQSRCFGCVQEREREKEKEREEWKNMFSTSSIKKKQKQMNCENNENKLIFIE